MQTQTPSSQKKRHVDLKAWFADSAYIVGDEPAISLRQFQERLKALDIRDLLPKRDAQLAHFIERCVDRLGLTTGPVVSRPGQAASGSHVRQAFTLPQVTSILWEGLAGAVARFVAQEMDFTPPKKARFEWQATLLDEASWDAASCVICSSMADGAAELEPTSVDECVELIAVQCMTELGVRVDADLLKQHVAPLCISVIEPSLFLAKTFVRTDRMSQLVGVELSQRLWRRLYNAEWHHAQADVDISSPELAGTRALAQELVIAMAELARTKAALAQATGLPGCLTRRPRQDIVEERRGAGRNVKDR